MRISDTHNDFLTKLDNTTCLNYLKKCENQGVKNLLSSVFTSELAKNDILQKIEDGNDLIKIHQNTGYKLHIEDLGFLNSTKDIKRLININPFSCSLTWNNDNKFAGGNFGFSTISKNGKKLISLLQQNNILIDTAHLNRKSFCKFLQLNNKPIFCSHTGLCLIKKSPRNLTNTQVKEIISSNGYIGIFLSSTFMTNNHQLNSKLFASIIYKIMCKFGDSNFGLGSDFYGISPNPIDINNYSDLSKVKNELKSFGVSEGSINKFFYKNFNTFLDMI